MNIAHYIDNLRPESGGTVKTVLDLCDRLAAHNHRVTVFTHDASGAPGRWLTGDGRGPHVHRLQPTRGRLHSMSSDDRRSLPARLAGFDAAHVHGMWERAASQFAESCGAARVPYVVSAHGMLDDWCMAQGSLKKRLYLAIVQRRWLRRAAWVHTTAEAERRQAQRRAPGARVAVVPHVFDLAEFASIPDPAQAREAFAPLGLGEPTVLFLSRIHPKKGVEKLLRATRAMLDAGHRVQVLIAGSGDADYVRSIEELRDSLGLTESAHLLGMVTGSLKLSLYAACDLFVLPTSQENWGFVFFESLACGTPVLTTRGVDPWPELEASGGARIVETGISPERLSDAAWDLLSAPGRLREMGGAGRAWVMRDLDPDRVVEQMLDLYRAGVPESSPERVAEGRASTGGAAS